MQHAGNSFPASIQTCRAAQVARVVNHLGWWLILMEMMPLPNISVFIHFYVGRWMSHINHLAGASLPRWPLKCARTCIVSNRMEEWSEHLCPNNGMAALPPHRGELTAAAGSFWSCQWFMPTHPCKTDAPWWGERRGGGRRVIPGLVLLQTLKFHSCSWTKKSDPDSVV